MSQYYDWMESPSYMSHPDVTNQNAESRPTSLNNQVYRKDSDPLSSPQDLSSFAMPLLENEPLDVNMMETDEFYRPRQGSTGSNNGFFSRTFFRKKSKGSREEEDSKISPRSPSPKATCSSYKNKSIFDGFRSKPNARMVNCNIQIPVVKKRQNSLSTSSESASGSPCDSSPRRFSFNDAIARSAPATPMSRLLITQSDSLFDTPSPSSIEDRFQFRCLTEGRAELIKKRLNWRLKQENLHGQQHPFTAEPPRHYIISKDATRLYRLPPTDEYIEEDVEMKIENLDEDIELSYVKFMSIHTCYDLIPMSSKLVIFEIHMNVKKAFHALLFNGVRAAILWDARIKEFVGMWTITDFIKILGYYYKSSEIGKCLQIPMCELDEHKIITWREELKDYSKRMIQIGPEASLFEATQLLLREKVHRLPIIDSTTGNALYILTHKRLVNFLYLHLDDMPMPSFMQRTIEDLEIGTFKNIQTITPFTFLIDVINIFLEKRVSALPIVDHNNNILGLFSKFDVIKLAADKTYNDLDVSVGEAYKEKITGFSGVCTCMKNESIETIIKRIVKEKVYRFCITDEDKKLVGIISLSDILEYLIQKEEINSVSSGKLYDMILEEDQSG